MTRFVAVFAVVVLCSGCGSGEGDARPVPPAEIESALAGNTIIGEWLGEDYRQFFDVDGTTIYLPVGSTRSSSGRWRVNARTGGYESWWSEPVGWEPYVVTRAGDTWYWSNDTVEASPFEIVPGNQLAATG